MRSLKHTNPLKEDRLYRAESETRAELDRLGPGNAI
jgi:hypothetical protein